MLLFLSLGQEFNPTLDEKNIVMEARRIPSTSLAQSQAMQLDVERAVQQVSAGGVRVLQHRHAGDRRRSDAAECLRHLHHSEAAGANGRIPS